MGQRHFFRQWGQREDRPQLRVFRHVEHFRCHHFGRIGKFLYIHLLGLGISLRIP